MNLSSFLQRLSAARVRRKTKDTLVAVGAKDRFNQMIRPYGKVLEFQLSTRERTVFASFRLKGELEAIQFWIHQYQLVADKKGQTFRARFSRNGGRGRHCGEQALPGNGSGANCVSVSGSCEVRVAALAFAKKECSGQKRRCPGGITQRRGYRRGRLFQRASVGLCHYDNAGRSDLLPASFPRFKASIGR
jgi:hypothetical protein